MKLRCIGDRVLIKRSATLDTTPGGIVIPDTAKGKSEEGRVISAGSGKLVNNVIVPLAVKEGDKVLFAKYSGSEIKIDGEEYVILREDEVLGVVE